MAKLIYTHSVMNSGKSTYLLQASHNYTREGRRTFLISHEIDDRFGNKVIASRIGLSEKCYTINDKTNIRDVINEDIKKNGVIYCILADEVQFYTIEQIEQLSLIVEELNIPVMTYGLRVNFKSELFPASKRLFELAHEIRNIKTVCHCNKAATQILRFLPDGTIVREGESVLVGAESMYQSVCLKHWRDGNLGDTTYKKLGINNPFN